MVPHHNPGTVSAIPSPAIEQGLCGWLFRRTKKAGLNCERGKNPGLTASLLGFDQQAYIANDLPRREEVRLEGLNYSRLAAEREATIQAMEAKQANVRGLGERPLI